MTGAPTSSDRAGHRAYDDGRLVIGYHQAWNRWLTERQAWCDEHPTFDWVADIIRRHPDEPWPVRDQ